MDEFEVIKEYPGSPPLGYKFSIPEHHLLYSFVHPNRDARTMGEMTEIYVREHPEYYKKIN